MLPPLTQTATNPPDRKELRFMKVNDRYCSLYYENDHDYSNSVRPSFSAISAVLLYPIEILDLPDRGQIH